MTGRSVVITLAGWLLATPLVFGQGLSGSEAVPPSISPNGYGGVGLTPSAIPTPQGTAAFGFQTALPGVTRASGYNFVGSIGLLPGLEVTGRIAAGDLQCRYFVTRDNCGKTTGIRDLSAGLKLTTSLLEFDEGALLIAAGVSDFGGAATQLRSLYAVGTLNVDRWSVSAGYIDPISRAAFGEGPFASVSWIASESMQLNVEAVNRDVFASARVWMPRQWLPDRVAIYADVHRHVRVVSEIAPETSYGVGLAVDLDPLTPSRPPPNPFKAIKAARGWVDTWIPRVEGLARLRWAESTSAEEVEDRSRGRASDVSPADRVLVSAADDQAWAVRIVAALETEGFEDVAVGRHPADGRWVVRFENADYLHNDLDALAVVAGLLVTAPEETSRPVAIRLLRRGVEAIELKAETGCLLGFLEGRAAACVGGPATLGAVEREWWSDVEWSAKGRRRSWLTPRLYVVPAIESRVAQEYGVWDASFAANVAIHVPLWRGALIEGTQIFPVSNTGDFEPGQVFSRYRYKQSENFRVMLHQAVGLPYGLSARAAVGRVGKLFEGGLAELRWEPLDGTHKFGVEASRFKLRDESLAGDRYARSELATYRYFNRYFQATLEAKAGRFFNGDEGFLVFSRFWFGDVAITPYYRKTKREDGYFPERPFGRQIVPGLPERAFAGLEFSFPLAPRKGYSNRWFRANGNDRFFYGIETVVNSPSNDLLREYGQFTPVPLSLDGTVFNFDRASDAYLQSNLRRLPALWRRSMALGGP